MFSGREIYRMLLFLGSVTPQAVGTCPAVAAEPNVIEISRASTVQVFSVEGKLNGSGFMISNQHVVTALHVASTLRIRGKEYSIGQYFDLQVKLPDGEMLPARCVTCTLLFACDSTGEFRYMDQLLPTACTTEDLAPVEYDFAILKLPIPRTRHTTLRLATSDEKLLDDDEVVFSGYPLSAPGMVTQKGFISGFDQSKDFITVRAASGREYFHPAVKEGYSGGAVLNRNGQVIGIIEIGYVRAIRFLRNYLASHPKVLEYQVGFPPGYEQ
jgi:V8-like Glu-specific endopeptidase